MEDVRMYIPTNIMARVCICEGVSSDFMIQFNWKVETYQQLVKIDFKAQGSILKGVNHGMMV